MPENATIVPSLDDGRLMFAFAHDARAHLRTILTRIQLVQRRSLATLAEEDRGLLEEAANSANEINGLLSAMVTLVSPEDPHGETRLKLLLQGALIELKPRLMELRAEVDVENSLDVPVPSRLKRVIKELLTNACKFRDANRPLKIRVATKITPDSSLEIAVSDNGLGVAPAYLDQIFTPFIRLHSRVKYPGYGLGLAICRRVLAELDGSITAEVAPEGGLTLHVIMPCCPHMS